MSPSPLPPRADRIDALKYQYATRPTEALRACNLCDGKRWTIITHHDRYGFPAPSVTCETCGLTVINPRMTPAAYGDFYERIYRPLVSAYHGRRIDARSIQAEQRTYAEEMAGVIAPFLGPQSRPTFLDVGGSTGVVAAHFSRRFGVRATVLDPAPDEIAEAKALGIRTVTGFVEDWNPGREKFDLVGMFQTIDHLLDVRRTLAKIRRLIREDGLFVVDIVDFRAAYLKNWSVEAATKIDHPFSLTEDTAAACLARAGFEPVRRAYSADHHLVTYICRPSKPQPRALPSPESVRQLLREIRYVQNAPRPGGSVA